MRKFAAVLLLTVLALGIPLSADAWHWGRPHYFWPYPFIFDPWPYYPPPIVYTPAPQPPQYPEKIQPNYWYWCINPQGYYPYIQQCPGGWLQVVPQTAPPGVKPPR